MTNAQLNLFANINVNDLEQIKKLIEQKEEELYEVNWKAHNKIDDYIYVIHYADGEYHYDYLGQRAYERYLEDKDATWIERKTKDVFPEYEFLERKVA